MANGFFKLVSDQTGYGLLLKAPTEGGEPVRVSEATQYLSERSIACDAVALAEAISSNRDRVLHLAIGECPKEDMAFHVTVSEDGMRAVARLFAPSERGSMPPVANFTEDLRLRNQVTFGVNEDVIKEAFEKELFCTDITVAEGKAPRQGEDARIEYFFNTDLRAKPTVNADGSVDFFHLNMINHCQQGEVLARLIREDPGESGMSVQGAQIKPRDVKKLQLRYGNNIELSEDGTELTSKVNGHVTLVEGRVFVSNVLELENVDISTGNVDYDGSVTISGNVQSNFSVIAKGNIVVNGLVEGAYLEAGGDIIIARGMVGRSKGELKAGGNVVAKFLENTKVVAEGNITTESILHSTVMSGKDIAVDGRRGFIAGGRVCAANQVDVKTLGSQLGTTTIIEVGADPVTKRKFQEMQKTLAELTRIVKSLDPIIATYAQKRKQGEKFTPEQVKYISSVLKLKEQKSEELENVFRETRAMQEFLEQQANAQVIVRGEVFPGTTIVIGDVSMAVPSDMKYCKFIKQQGDVKMVAI